MALILCLAACADPAGPLEKELQKLEATERADLAPVDRRKLVKQTLRLIDRKQYNDPIDIERRDDLMYRASLLAAVHLHDMKNVKAARSLYMNAFLLNEQTALQDLRKQLGADADLKPFEAVKVPDYKIVNESEKNGIHFYNIAVQHALPYYLVQMVCGDIVVRKIHAMPDAEKPERIIARVSDPAGLLATGNWDQEKDAITIKMKR